jgi:hypothetical protein
MQGRRREDTDRHDLPPEIQPGDYWKVLVDGEPALSENPENLTGTVWMFMAPHGSIGTLINHTVREHDDGTISVVAGDGSSNSILQTGAQGSWHGYIDHGVWNEC